MLVAIEPRAYREAIGFAIENLRPDIEVSVCAPETLVSEVNRLTTTLVICSGPDQEASGEVVAWMEFRTPQDYPQRAAVRIGDHRFELANVQLDDLLLVVDRTDEATRPDRLAGNR